MFNLEWLKNLIKREPEPSLDERIAGQVHAMHDIAMANLHTLGRGHNDRLKALEARSENVDAFYVKTVTQALSERQDKIAESLNVRMDLIRDHNEGRMDVIEERHNSFAINIHNDIANMHRALREELDANLARSQALESKLAALVSKLRAGLE